ncbi:hypothetical protein FOZ63_020063 [Perkinsus olseni]|uniref:Uncharacterized protein n=1 Tax=Perkinsus olseni TaxID=32597 RepID=A0A7J6PWD2_PEROL|nr:hypothetical protein FOZ63_020063 [Perkinsus olseni]
MFIPHGFMLVALGRMVAAMVSAFGAGPGKAAKHRWVPYDVQNDRDHRARNLAGIAALRRQQDHLSLNDMMGALSVTEADSNGIQLAQLSLDEMMSQHSITGISSGSRPDDTCSSTWGHRYDSKRRAKGNSVGLSQSLFQEPERVATFFARRGSPTEPFHLDYVSFEERFESAASYRELSGPLGTLIPEREMPDNFKYVAEYYVNLRYFMHTELGGDGLICEQQLERRLQAEAGQSSSPHTHVSDHDAHRANLDGYDLAFNMVRYIATDSGRLQYWSVDELGVKRSVRLGWASDPGKYMIVSLTVISPRNMKSPNDNRIHYSRLEELNRIAWPARAPSRKENSALDQLRAYGRAAAAFEGIRMRHPSGKLAVRLIHKALFKDLTPTY